MAGNNNTLFVISEIKPEEDRQRREELETSVMDGVEFEREEIKPEEQARLDLYSVPKHVPTQEIRDASEPALHQTTVKVERKKVKRETKTPYTREKLKTQKQDRIDLYNVPKHVPIQEVKVDDDNQSALLHTPPYESTLEIKQKDGESLSVIAQKRQEIKPEEQDRMDLYSIPPYGPTQEVKLEDTIQLALHDIPAFQGRLSEEEEDSDGLLKEQRENATNAQILAQNTVTIHVKKVIRKSAYVSKPAKELQCDRLDSIEVPTGDPQKAVKNRMILLCEKEGLLPHNGMGRRVNIEDCYEVAINADDHTLYMIEEEL